jgi:hypothetical protein
MSPDYNGIKTYASINYEPTVAEIVARWKEPISSVRKAYERFKKPIIITELSACSYDGAASMDWQYYPKVLTDKPVDFQEEADLFEGTMRALTPLECVCGVSWNQWNAFEPASFTRRAKRIREVSNSKANQRGKCSGTGIRSATFTTVSG